MQLHSVKDRLQALGFRLKRLFRFCRYFLSGKRCDCGRVWRDYEMSECEDCGKTACDKCGFWDGYQWLHRSCDFHLWHCIGEGECDCANGPHILDYDKYWKETHERKGV